jgi:hypothetical protein
METAEEQRLLVFGQNLAIGRPAEERAQRGAGSVDPRNASLDREIGQVLFVRDDAQMLFDRSAIRGFVA